MKKVLSIIVSLTIALFSIAQNDVVEKIAHGTITYEQVVKFEIKLDGEAAQFMQNMPKERRSEKVLYFSPEASLYQNATKSTSAEEVSMDEEGPVMIKMMEPENKFYTDLENGKQIEQREFMTRLFLIEKELENNKWKITGNQKTILDYPCQEAVLEKDDKKVYAWFAPSIPFSAGPLSYGNLPGMILELNMDDGNRIITATSINTENDITDQIVKPKKGKKVTREEFEKIRDEKLKEAGMDGGNGQQIVVKIKHQ